MPTTTNHALPYPSSTDPVNVPADIQALAEAVDAKMIADTLIDAKGDLVVGTASDTAARLAVGSNNLALIADSAESAGVKWGQIPTAGIADSAVTSAKIADGTIATGDLADGAVTSAKIADATIVNGDVANGTLQEGKMIGIYHNGGTVRNNRIFIQSATPTGAVDGDVWIQI
jgi:hypothetical protein